MNILKNILYSVCIVAAMVLGCLAQDKTAKPANPVSVAANSVTPASDALKPVTLTAAQVTQLQDAQKALELAEAKANEAAANLKKLQYQIEALVMAYRWELGVNPKQYKPGLQVVDEQTGALGFVPLSKQ
jgi:hypothetical protein